MRTEQYLVNFSWLLVDQQKSRNSRASRGSYLVLDLDNPGQNRAQSTRDTDPLKKYCSVQEIRGGARATGPKQGPIQLVRQSL